MGTAMTRRGEEDVYGVTRKFQSYVSKPEITDLPPNFLVRGSKNVLVDYAQRIVSRNGYELYRDANTGAGGIKSSYEWDTSTGKQFSLRSYDSQIEFDWNSDYNVLMSGFSSVNFEFAKVWDNTEKIDILIFVNGEAKAYKWSGGVSKVRVGTAATITKQGVLTGVTFAFVAGTAGTVAPTITDSSNGFVDAGFAAGDTLYVTGSTANSRNFTIGSVTAGTITLIMGDSLTSEIAGPAITMHNGEPTWGSARFLTTGTRKFLLAGVEYTYTGGESTDTLTGITPALPAITAGDAVWQTVVTLSNPAAIPASFKQDLVGVQLNQLIFANTKSQEIYGSSASDYTTFALTSPRAPGDPFKLTMDNYCTCIVPVDNPEQTDSNLIFGGGTNEFFKMKFKLAQDNSSELVSMIKLKTGTAAGLIAKGAITAIKNQTAYISREPTLDSLGAVDNKEGKQNTPISDLIKDDFDSYDFTNAHMKYWKRALYIALPAEGILLIYDLQRELWQPPQTIPVSRLAVIGDWLYGHSSVSNETYKLFIGTTDNGVFIPQVARFAYNNGGDRTRLKNMSEYWSDGYITANAELDLNVYLGFNGSVATNTYPILGSDTAITTTLDASPIGSEVDGAVPLGGAAFADLAGLPGSGVPLLRFWQPDTMPIKDYTEFFVEYTMNTEGGQFALVAHGGNQWDAGTSAVSHKK